MDREWTRVSVEAPEDEIDAAVERLRAAGASGSEIQDASTWRVPARPLAAGRARAIAYFPGIAPEDLRARIGQELAPGWTLLAEAFADRSWKESWKAYLRPMVVSARLAVAPPWDVPRFDPPVRTLILEPGLAFGSGTHPTTRLCLAWLDELLDEDPDASVLDVGCGTGVLAIGAALLAAPGTRIVAVDVDPEAIRISRQNACANAVACRIEIVEGPPDPVRGRFDLVLANILPSVLIELAHSLAAALHPGGRLVLSGILGGRGADVETRYRAEGLTLLGRRAEKEWSSLLFGA